MNFNIDVLIIFSQKDNESDKNSQTGWVTNFKKFLELILYQVLGKQSNVVLKSDFDSITASTMDNIGVMVAILSNDFAQCGQCLDNLEAFVKYTDQLSNPVRLFKAMKSTMSLQEQPSRLRDLLPYEMYMLDMETGITMEYSDFFSEDAEKQYWMKLIDLAYDISESLQILKLGAKPEIKTLLKKKTIYLAETGHDLAIQKNIIKRELQRHGYVVLPKTALNLSASELKRQVTKDLEECSFSIHLIGNSYGEIPEGEDRSVVDIQNELATEHATNKREKGEDFTRLIWISPALKTASDKQKSFIENLKRQNEAQEGTEILQNPLEDFKNIMRQELSGTHDRIGGSNVRGNAIYLLHDKIDHKEVQPLIDAIEKSGFKVLMPAFEGELLDVRKRHIENLRNLDGAIIYKGKVSEHWLQMKVLDLLKAPGFGRNKPIMAKALICPDTKTIEKFKNQNLTLIHGDAHVSIQEVKTFLEEFKN